MSIRYISSREPVLDRIIEFSIVYANENKDEEINLIYQSLQHYSNLSYGKIYKSNLYNNYWYLNSTETLATLISEDRIHALQEWDNLNLLPNDILFEKLIQIGGIPSSKYSLKEDCLQFPCRVKIKNEQWIDFCIINFSKAPPIQSYYNRIIFLDDVIDIEPSEFSLTHELRLASTLATDIRMGFFPFMVKTVDDKLITYNETTHFASEGDVKGNDIVCEVAFSYDNFDKVKEVPNENITYVIGKWDDRLYKLFIEYRERLEIMKTPNGLNLNMPTGLNKIKASISLFYWDWINKFFS